MILLLEALYVLGTTLEGRAIGLVGDVALEDLVHYLKVMLVADLLGVTSEDNLVLFSGGHVSLLLSHPAVPAGTAVVPLECCQPETLGASLAKVYSPECLEGEFSEVRIRHDE